MNKISHQYALENLSYCPDSGKLFWIKRRRGRPVSGEAGTDSTDGYWKVCIDGFNYPAHQIAWLIFHGEWPRNHIDHINGDGKDNRISNLRLATMSENAMNRAKRNGSSSKYIGVFREKNGNPWRARITIGGKTICLGRYKTEEEARDAYIKGKAKYHLFNPVIRDEK